MPSMLKFQRIQETRLFRRDGEKGAQNGGFSRFACRLRIGVFGQHGFWDPLYCDAEVLHRHLLSLDFPHTYARIEGAGHSLAEIV